MNKEQYLEIVCRQSGRDYNGAINTLSEKLNKPIVFLNYFVSSTKTEKIWRLDNDVIWLFTETDIIECRFSEQTYKYRFIPIRNLSNITIEFDDHMFSVTFNYAGENFVLFAIGDLRSKHLIHIYNDIISKK